MHGGVLKENLKKENLNALKKGLPNLKRHIENIKKFGLDLIVAINRFETDTKKEIEIIEDFCANLNIKVSLCTHWAHGGKGTKDLAEKVVKLCKKTKKSKFNFIYNDKNSLTKKIEVIAILIAVIVMALAYFSGKQTEKNVQKFIEQKESK